MADIDLQAARTLLDRAMAAAEHAYAPFSKIRVGAALLTRDGTTYDGVNVENSSYGLTICAERVALFKAVSEGKRDFVAVAVACSGAEGCGPCGACRQVLYEFAPDLIVIMDGKPDPELKALSSLLPHGFRLQP